MESIFKCKEFSIIQNSLVHKVGTDAMLLGSFVCRDIAEGGQLLDIGTGTGILTLMMAQKYNNRIYAIEPEIEAYQLAKRNFENSPFKLRIELIQQMLDGFVIDSKSHPMVYSTIVCNPPYYLQGDKDGKFYKSMMNNERFQQRQGIALLPNDLLSNVSKLLEEDGNFWLILPFEGQYYDEIFRAMKSNQLFLKKEIFIRSFKNNEQPIRSILEIGKKEIMKESENFYIYDSEKIYSKDYLHLTKDFHQWSEKAVM